jgi:luciferase family oxidoreductase group 1
MQELAMLSILDIVPVPEDCSPGDALRRSIDLAQQAEDWGYNRYWIAEHHNMVGAAGAATGTVVAIIADATRTIRVGAGGIMLPNHAPLTVAEQFGTIESLHPGRIDLGLGRAPGTDPETAMALRRDRMAANAFQYEVMELRSYFAEPCPTQRVRAVPGAGLEVPIWILGSSPASGELAAKLGMPYAFASHFAPGSVMEAISLYRDKFQPSSSLAAPYVMLGVNVVVADTQREAERLFTSVQQRYVNILRRQPRKLPSPVDDMGQIWSNEERAQVSSMLNCSFVGTPARVEKELARFWQDTGANELIVSATLYDADARRRSYELLSGIDFAASLKSMQPVFQSAPSIGA